MQQNNDNRDNTNETNDKENWTNEHGYPSHEFLESLTNNMEKLRSIATDLDVEYGPNDSAQALIDKIMEAEQGDPNTTT